MADDKHRRRHIVSVVAVVFVCAVIALVVLAEAVLHGGRLARWDEASNVWFHAHETNVGDRIAVLVSVLGLPAAWIVGIAVGIILLWLRRRLLWVGWALALGGGGLVERTIKAAVDRARPPYAGAFLHGHSSSFPSGHAMAACLCYVTLAYVVTRLAALDRARSAALYAAAGVIVAGVSWSRLYLAVHYPTDVAAGILAATAWLAVCIGGTEYARDGPARDPRRA